MGVLGNDCGGGIDWSWLFGKRFSTINYNLKTYIVFNPEILCSRNLSFRNGCIYKDKFIWNTLCNSKNLEIIECSLINACIMVQHLQEHIGAIKSTDSTNLEICL